MTFSMDGYHALALDRKPLLDGFGDWDLAPTLSRTAGRLLPDDDAGETRKLLRRDVPRVPGVYGMLDAPGDLIYVGQSKSLQDRLLSYWSTAAQAKAQRIVAHTRRLIWETSPDALAAQLRELELIRRWRPRMNVRGIPGRFGTMFLLLGRGPAPHVYLAAAPGRGTNFGPLRATRRTQQAVQLLNDYFQLRNCAQQIPIRFSDQRELFGESLTALCLRHALGTCLGPCARECSSGDYHRQVRAARRFLRGTDQKPLARLQKAMAASAAEKRYELAAVFRNVLDALQNLHDQLFRIRDAQQNYRFVYPLKAHNGDRSWYLIDRGQVLSIVAEPRTPPAAAEFLARIEDLEAGASRDHRAGEGDVLMQLLVSGWFRGHVEELPRTWPLERAKRWLARRSKSVAAQPLR